jgi:hypothetical protein
MPLFVGFVHFRGDIDWEIRKSRKSELELRQACSSRQPHVERHLSPARSTAHRWFRVPWQAACETTHLCFTCSWPWDPDYRLGLLLKLTCELTHLFERIPHCRKRRLRPSEASLEFSAASRAAGNVGGLDRIPRLFGELDQRPLVPMTPSNSDFICPICAPVVA